MRVSIRGGYCGSLPQARAHAYRVRMADGDNKRGKPPNEDPRDKRGFGSFKDLLRSQGGEPEPDHPADDRGWTLESADGRSIDEVGSEILDGR